MVLPENLIHGLELVIIKNVVHLSKRLSSPFMHLKFMIFLHSSFSVTELSSTLKPDIPYVLPPELPHLTEDGDTPPGRNHQILFVFRMQGHGVTS